MASIGLAQVLGGIELVGSKAIGFVALRGAFKVPLGLELDLGVKRLGGDEMLIVLVAPVVLAALGWFLPRTDTGVAVRGAAENVDRALLLGIPVRRNTTIVWMIAGALAALTFILKAPFTGIAPGVATTGPAVLLPALAAAVVARMESLPVALGAGIGLGIVEQVARWNTTGSPSFIDASSSSSSSPPFSCPATDARRSAHRHVDLVGHRPLRPIPAQLRWLPEVRGASRWARVLVLAAPCSSRARGGRRATSCWPASRWCGRWSPCRWSC